MDRRKFISRSGLAGAASLLPLGALGRSNITPGCHRPWRETSPETGPVFSGNPPSGSRKFKLGLQLFTVNDDMNRDPLGTLKAVQAMGYEDFEIYGFDPEPVTYYGLEAARLRSSLDTLGLTVSSGHYGFSTFFDAPEDRMRWFTDRCIQGALALGSPYITWPWLAPDYRTAENYRKLAGMLNRIGEQVKAAGLGFAYHNHGFEFKAAGEVTPYELLLRETDPELVKLQMDLYWVVHAGRTTPQQLVSEHPGRFVMWHIKDMDTRTRDYTELGNGSIHYPNILPDPDASGLEYYYIEQGGNFASSPLESVAASAAYFKEHVQGYFE
ncbi:Sugar phosphate isomerase/epimerase [Robiginitalea biformata HTCC2501]|uniref:Sugar phosphate isomerase/epimerase n=2 Tax=Robiginitalea TaxID=252306 RepID=A4CM94_ROBBH|nr:Sugar phosphate isomerase/epimerase [Robiginitalea biformata HTCC2501]